MYLVQISASLRPQTYFSAIRRSLVATAGTAPNAIDVDSVDAWPTNPDFERLYFDRAPLVVKGGVKHWPAMHKWSSAYLRDRCGNHEVPVEIGGSSYLDPNMQRVEMPLALYLDYLDGLEDDFAPPPSHRAYMAQARLPGLLDLTGGSHGGSSTSSDDSSNDIDEPAAVAALGRGDVYARMAWLGPKGTVTPLHRDPYHNILAQVHGSKRLIIFAPKDESNLYPSKDPLQTNSSQVDAEAPDLVRFPNFARAQPWVAHLAPGDLVYIPKRWWHHVRALTKATSVSIWWL